MRNELVFSAVFLALAASAARADTLKVPKKFATIAAAEAAANDGDTILIFKGRYAETVTTTKRLKFVGKRGAVWDGFIGGSGKNQLVATADGVSVSGISFEQGAARPLAITGDGATVTRCSFRSCDGGVYIDGANAKVVRNRFIGQESTDDSVEIHGPGALVQSNQFVAGAGATIDVDAESGGSARVIGNLFDSQGDTSAITVRNAAAPRVERNTIGNAYTDGGVVNVLNCDDAVVMRNLLTTINYSVEYGILVTGARASVMKNRLEYLNYYDGDHYSIYVDGADARVQRNSVKGCGAGEDYDTYAVYVTGSGADVSRNRIEDLAGGGDETYGVYVDGDDGSVSGNTIDDLNDEYTYAVYYDGDRGKIVGNRIEHVMYDPDIYVRGDDFQVIGNSVRNGAYYCTGIYASGDATSPGKAVIEGNSISNVGWTGIEVSGDGVIVRRNRVVRAADFGFEISGSSNTLIDNSAFETYEDGFHVTGTANKLTNCVTRDTGGDGFDIGGDANVLERCVATDCTEEGLDNADGTGTTATRCTLEDCRIDYAGNGTMASDTGTSYVTGGPDTAPDQP